MHAGVTLVAQKNENARVQWRKEDLLLPAVGKEKSIGVAGPVCGVHEETLIVGGGANFPEGMPWAGGKKKYHSGLFIYRKQKDEIKFLKESQLPFPVAYSASCSSPFGIISAGGENDTGILNKVVLVKWDTPSERVITTPLPDLPVASANASMVWVKNRIYLAGGESGSGCSDQFISLDLDHVEDGWRPMKPLPSGRSHSVLIVQSNGKQESIYLMGGRNKNQNGISTVYSSVYEFDLKGNKWLPRKGLPCPMSAGTGIPAGLNLILLFSGDTGETFHQVEMLLAEIKAESDLTKRKSLTERKNLLLASHPGFNKNILQYNTSIDEWQTAGTLPFEGQVTTRALNWFDLVIIPSGEIRAGVRTPAIHVGKVVTK